MQTSLSAAIVSASVAQASEAATEAFYWAQNQVHEGPMGPEFGDRKSVV